MDTIGIILYSFKLSATNMQYQVGLPLCLSTAQVIVY